MRYEQSAPKRMRVSFVTTCMGRRRHIERTLLRNLHDNRDYPECEFVLLDYNSKDGLAEWVRDNCREQIESGRLVYWRTVEPTFFHMSHAKNVAHLLATGEVVVNLDGDNFTGEGKAAFLADLFTKTRSLTVRCGRDGDEGTGGRIAIRKEHFLALGGYEERMKGWGYEDADLMLRCRNAGIKKALLSRRFCTCIDHDDSLRELHHTPPGQAYITKGESLVRNFRLMRKRANSEVANANFVWGRAVITRNFRQEFVVNSRLGAPRLRADVNLDLFEQKHEAVQPPPVRRTAGKFVISKDLILKQTNAPVED